MTTTEILSIRQPEDILAYIPHLLGYWPEDSLVAITMQGKILGATLRVDLPTVRSDAALAGFAAHVRSCLRADKAATGVVLAVYTDDGWGDGTVLASTLPLLSELQGCLERAGLEVRDAWLVGSEYWRGAFCGDEDCCPFPGLPVDRIRSSQLGAEMVYRGSAVGPRPGSRRGTGDADMPMAGGAPMDPAILAAEEYYAGCLEEAWKSLECLRTVTSIWAQLLDAFPASCLLDDAAGTAEGVKLAGFLRATLRRPAWRDAVVVMAAAGMETAEAGAVAFGLFPGDDSADLPVDPADFGLDARALVPSGAPCGTEQEHGTVYSYGEVLLGIEPGLPDWARLDALQQLLSRIIADEEQGVVAAAALTMQGWIAWCKGSGSHAHACLVKADAAEPGYRLAELLNGIMGQGTICPWAMRQESAWGTHKSCGI